MNIRKGLSGTYFEDLIRQSILNNNHKVLVSIYPERGLQERKDAEVKRTFSCCKSEYDKRGD